MNELLDANNTMTSLQIAEVTGMRHADVMRAIRNMEGAWVKVNQRNFALTFRTTKLQNGAERKDPLYVLTKTECLYVATKFNDEARAKLVIRWEELERERQAGGFRVPQNLAEALRLAADQAERAEAQQRQIEAMKPKALFADAVATSDRSCLVAELAKILQQNGVNIGQNRLFAWLREHGYLGTRGEYYNQPTQRAMGMGLFEIKKTSITKPDGSVLVTTTTKVTGKGQIYFVNKVMSEMRAK